MNRRTPRPFKLAEHRLGDPITLLVVDRLGDLRKLLLAARVLPRQRGGWSAVADATAPLTVPGGGLPGLPGQAGSSSWRSNVRRSVGVTGFAFAQ